ncbi:hypothetical protein ACHAWF_013736 [Thalassiosira exigua]
MATAAARACALRCRRSAPSLLPSSALEKSRATNRAFRARRDARRLPSSPPPNERSNLRGGESSPPSDPLSSRSDRPVDVGAVAERLGVRLTACESQLLKKKLDFDEDGIVTRDSFAAASRRALEDRTVREICLQVIEQPTTAAASLGTRFVRVIDYLGCSLFSVVGTQVAGDAGFNLIGCTLVGSVAGLGGRTINNLLYGNSSPLLKQMPGVFWARDPSYLVVAIFSSLLTFFAWPAYCDEMSTYYLDTVVGEQNLEDDGSVGKEAFVKACESNEDFLDTIRAAQNALKDRSAEEIFHRIDLDHSGTICAEELKLLVQERVRNSGEMYAVDTVALAAISVAGVHGAIRMGLHPVVAAVSGVTMSVGGILRDLFCGRDLAVASQSYALATLAGSSVYVLCRELSLRGFPILAIYRIILSMGTTMSLRYWEYVRGEPLLAPMHGREKDSTFNPSHRHGEPGGASSIIGLNENQYELTGEENRRRL